MDTPSEIATRVAKLSPELQARVLQFVESLTDGYVVGEPGAALLPFAGSLDPQSAKEMMDAIQEGCEQSV